MREVKGPKATYFYYDGQRVVAEYEKSSPAASETLARYFVDGPMYVDEHVLMHEGGNGAAEGKDFYYLLGALYTVAGLADADGKIVQAYSYDAYGGVRNAVVPPTVTGGGSRYLLASPADQGDIPVALVVDGDPNDPNVACVREYVRSRCADGLHDGLNCLTDADCPKACSGGTRAGLACTTDQDCPAGKCRGKCYPGSLGPEPFYKLSSQWGTARIRGAEIRPGTTYRVATQADFPGGPVLSEAAAAATWRWGDTDGDGDVNALDILRVIDGFKQEWTGLTFEQVNVWGCTPDQDKEIDALDISLTVDAFKGFAFPCAVPTCGTSNLPPHNPYRFTGRRLDFDLRDANGRSRLALYDYRGREYDARHGRFLQRDPAGYVDGANLYEYARSNPEAYVDPSGKGVFTLLFAGDYSASDWQFIRDGGLKAIVSGAAQGALQGGIDSAIGAGMFARELAYSAIDVPVGLADIASTLAFGESLGAPLSQLSRAGSNPDSLAEVIADAGSRNVLNGVSFGAKDLPWVIEYVRYQKKHHAKGQVHDRLERIERLEDGGPVEKPVETG